MPERGCGRQSLGHPRLERAREYGLCRRVHQHLLITRRDVRLDVRLGQAVEGIQGGVKEYRAVLRAGHIWTTGNSTQCYCINTGKNSDQVVRLSDTSSPQQILQRAPRRKLPAVITYHIEGRIEKTPCPIFIHAFLLQRKASGASCSSSRKLGL